MRRLGVILLGIVLSFSQVLYAQQISESEAKDKALSFFNSRPSNDGGALRAAGRGMADIQLAYKASDGKNNFFYVYNRGGNDGFVIVGGDAVAHGILAYVPQGHFCYDSIPDNVRWWLGEYEKEISIAIKMQSQSRHSSAVRRSAQSGATAGSSVRDLFTDIPDLITTKWDQTSPYNAGIPAIHYTDGRSVIPPTGCVPTAIAQIMNYWQWPIAGVGSHSYTLDYGTLDEESAGANPGDFDGLLPATFSADFGNTTYDWTNMLDDYSVGNPTQAQIDAVSTLMYHVGVAGETLYGPKSSGGGMDRAMAALKNNFGYSERLTYLRRGDYLDDEWEEIIYSELLAGRPVCYDSNQHAFLLHGYSADLQMFSVNWGWGGFMDGYYKITGTDFAYFMDDDNYNLDFVTHCICIGIEPDNIVQTNSFKNVGDTIVVDGIRYDLIGPLSKTVEVTYAPNYEIIYEGDLTIPETIDYNNETYTVTKIGRYGLACGFDVDYYGIKMEMMSSLMTIHLPSTLRSIANHGISGCQGIKELQVPESVEMLAEGCFSSMINLTNVTLPNQLSYIPTYCFMDCIMLESINLPASIKAIGYFSFYDCPSLDLLISNAIEVPAHNTTPGYTASFDQNLDGKFLAVPKMAIDEYRNDPLFGQWGNIIPIDSIEYFYKKFVVDEILYKLLSGNDVSIAGYLGDGIDTLVIPSSIIYDEVAYQVKAIGYNAFNKAKIGTLIINEGVREVEGYSFSQSQISSVFLPHTIDIIGNYAFWCCQNLKEVHLLNGITRIGGEAFEGCWQMEYFEMPNSVVSIGPCAFDACDYLEDIKLSSSLTEIPSYAFRRTNIKSIVLPSGLSKITCGCFDECTSLSTMICYAPTVPHFEEWDGLPAFPSNISQGTLYVPSESVSAYQSADGWNEWGEILPIVPVESIYLDDISVCKLLVDTISVTVFPNNATKGQIFYSSSNPQVAMISIDGVVTALKVGETTITAETLDGKTATCTVTVFNKYSLTYLVDSQVYSTDSIEYGAPITPIAVPVREGYTFSGWSEIPSTMPANDVTVTGSFTVNKYLLTYKADGETISSESIAYGTALTAKEAPTKEGYTFMGWNNLPETMPANDILVNGYFYSLKPGDANNDTIVNVADFVTIVNHIIEKPAPGFVERMADVDNNGEINVADVVGVTNLILDSNDPVFNRANSRSYEQNGTLSMQTDGENGLEFHLPTAGQYAAFQMDVDLPDGVRIKSVNMAADKHMVTFNQLTDGTWRILSASMTGDNLTTLDGLLMTVVLDGDQDSFDVTAHDILFSNHYMDVTIMDNCRASLSGSVTGMYQVEETVPGTIYDLNGIRLENGMQPAGIYIINGQKRISYE